MYDVGVDWVPSLNIPIPKIIPVPPPAEEHSYCQSTVPPTAYHWKTTVSGKIVCKSLSLFSTFALTTML